MIGCVGVGVCEGAGYTLGLRSARPRLITAADGRALGCLCAQGRRMPRVPAALLLAALWAGSAAGDAFVPLASATVGSPAAAAATRGRVQQLAGSPARTTALAGETAAIDPADYLEEANAWRAEVGAPPLVWDETIARVAQTWADHLENEGCDMVHSTSEWSKAAYKAAGGPEEALGENIAWACCADPPTQNGKDVVDMWASEKKSYAYGAVGEACTSHDGGTVGHYTQLVWAESQKMGCGMATCGDAGTVWVCNFFPSGNWMGEAPFCKANVPSDMPTCAGIAPGVGEGGIPCDAPAAKSCGYEEQCCSCEEDDAANGEHDLEEGRQDEAEGERDEAEGARDNDAYQVEEGRDEVQVGQIEVRRGTAEEEEYLMNHEFHKLVEITGLDENDFDEVKFQAALAEVLGVPLFDVTVGAVGGGGRRRRLLAETLNVPVTLKCDGRVACKNLLGQLEGVICNGALARALSEAFGTTIRTPNCQAFKTPLQPFDPENPHTITFPDDYPNSVRHWLLIGALCMMLGAGLVFIFTFVPAKTPPMANVVVFISCCVAMCAYYCMWAGILVDYKTSDVTPRVIFYPKYLDWIITCPLTLAAICLVAQAEAALLVSLVGNAVLMVLCGLVGSSVVAPYKYLSCPPLARPRPGDGYTLGFTLRFARIMHVCTYAHLRIHVRSVIALSHSLTHPLTHSLMSRVTCPMRMRVCVVHICVSVCACVRACVDACLCVGVCVCACACLCLRPCLSASACVFIRDATGTSGGPWG